MRNALRKTLDHLGIEKAVLAGHSMGGRLVTELAANHTDQAIAVLLLDAIVGVGERHLMKWQPKTGDTEKL